MDPGALRDDMVDGLEHALGRPLGERVLDALRTVPRHEFVAEAAYENRPGEARGSRVLAPATVARMLAALDARPGDEVLVVGGGVGYTAAALAEIVGARHVHAIDIDRGLVSLARENLAAAGYDAVLVDRRDGANGLPEYAPFDRVLVEAAAVEPPAALLDQLGDDGRLVLPRGVGGDGSLVAVEAGSPGAAGEPVGTGVGDDDYRVVDDRGPIRLRPLLVEGERPGVEPNRTRREDAEFARQGYFAGQGWEQDWVDWDERL